MRRLVPAAAVLLLVSCQPGTPAPASTPQGGGSSIGASVLANSGPRIPNGAIYVAGDITTLKALVDAGDSVASGQLGGGSRTFQCMAPYTFGSDSCWRGQSSAEGTAYIAFAIQGGFCEKVDPPIIRLSGFSLDLVLASHSVAGCHINGVLALPTASLISFSTTGLAAGLYSVDYVLDRDSDTYRSAATYLSVLSPPAGDQGSMESAAAAGLAQATATGGESLFSESRVDGGQLQALCGVAPSGPQFLVTIADAASRQMKVILVTPDIHQCEATAI